MSICAVRFPLWKTAFKHQITRHMFRRNKTPNPGNEYYPVWNSLNKHVISVGILSKLVDKLSVTLQCTLFNVSRPNILLRFMNKSLFMSTL